MSRPVPEHGSPNRYAYGCRCQPCTRAATRADAERRLDRLAGRPRAIPAGPTIAHAKALMSAGLTSWQVAREAGVEPSTVQRLVKGQVRVRASTAEKILRVPVGVRVSVGDVSSVGAVRRIRALYVMGHFVRVVAAEAGVSRDTVLRLARGEWPTIKVAADDGVRAAYDRLSMTAGSSWKARQTAERNGWASPLAWDDETIDDPQAKPRVDAGPEASATGEEAEAGEYVDQVAVHKFVQGWPVELTEAEYLTAVRACHEKGMSNAQIDDLRRLPQRSTETTLNRLRKRYERSGRAWPLPSRTNHVLVSGAGRSTMEEAA